MVYAQVAGVERVPLVQHEILRALLGPAAQLRDSGDLLKQNTVLCENIADAAWQLLNGPTAFGAGPPRQNVFVRMNYSMRAPPLRHRPRHPALTLRAVPAWGADVRGRYLAATLFRALYGEDRPVCLRHTGRPLYDLPSQREKEVLHDDVDKSNDKHNFTIRLGEKNKSSLNKVRSAPAAGIPAHSSHAE